MTKHGQPFFGGTNLRRIDVTNGANDFKCNAAGLPPVCIRLLLIVKPLGGYAAVFLCEKQILLHRE